MRNSLGQASLLLGFGEHFTQLDPEPERPCREHGRAHTPTLAAYEQVGSGLGRFTGPISEGNQFLSPVRGAPYHDQKAHIVPENC